MREHAKAKRHLWKLALLATASFVWLVVRSGRKPSRIAYPCQKAAVANVQVFLLALCVTLVDIGTPKASLRILDHRRAIKAVFLISCISFAFGFAVANTSYVPSANRAVPILLDLKSQIAPASVGVSDLFFVENASGFEGNMDEALSRLLQLMENHNIFFFKTTSHPDGLVGKDNVVIIKINCQWNQRGGTNTDLVKSLIKEIVSHPEGFVGEIVVSDNGQGSGSMDWELSNAFNNSQSMQDVANMFSPYKVSTYLWDDIYSREVNEYNQGDFTSGYVVNSTRNPVTQLYVTYPKFKTKYGTYISFKNGIWNNATSGYDSSKLKIINTPVLKSHMHYGVTASVKHYMGVVSQPASQYSSHDAIAYGGMGTVMAETRFPTLNLLDAIWVNANPVELTGGSPCGPGTSYGAASFANVIGASLDPVALDYWASKHILIPTAIQMGYTSYSSLDPDYEPITNPLQESFHNYLERSMNELKKAGHQVTMNASQMSVYLSANAKYDIGVRGTDSSKSVIGEGYNYPFNTTIMNYGAYTETFNVTLYVNDTLVGLQPVTLASGSFTTLTFGWNTSGFAKGNYTIKAVADILPGETHIEDNNLTGWVIVAMVGDITGPDGYPDGRCNMMDVGYAASLFGASYPDSMYNPNYDIDYDGKINMVDIGTIARHFGETDL